MITLMTKQHLDEVMRLEEELFTSPWTREAFEYELEENPFSHHAVLEMDGQIAGYCGLWCLFDRAEIANIAVAKAFQRRHLALRLMDWMEKKAIAEDCETISLEVRLSNAPAIALYKKCGFEIVSIRKDYYQDNHEDAWLMMKAIGGLK